MDFLTLHNVGAHRQDQAAEASARAGRPASVGPTCDVCCGLLRPVAGPCEATRRQRYPFAAPASTGYERYGDDEKPILLVGSAEGATH